MSTNATTAKESIDTQARITRHVEPPKQGGATYFRCACGREAMRRKDLYADMSELFSENT